MSGPPPGSHGQPDPSQKIMFYALIIPLFPSVLCFIFLFYNFIRNREILMKPTNRFFIYLFVFHNIFYRHHTILIVYIPMLLCFLVPSVYFSGVIFVYPCTNILVYSFWQCGPLCYLSNSSVVRTFENYAYLIVPTLMIVLGNIILLIRVLIQKNSMKEQGRLRSWRKNVRMIFQLVFVSILYMGVFVPSSVFLFMDSYVRNSGEEMWVTSVRVHYIFHIKYFVIFLYPFVILIGQTEMHEKIKKLFRCIRRQRNRVTVLPMNDMI
jgi:hypothetical protein